MQTPESWILLVLVVIAVIGVIFLSSPGPVHSSFFLNLSLTENECGNGACEETENPSNCAADCVIQTQDNQAFSAPYCGDHVCSTQLEDAFSCPSDCPTVCGDDLCTGSETVQNCSKDCKTGCGNGVCESSENNSCPADCGVVQEVVVFSETIDQQEIVPESVLDIQTRLKGLGLKTSFEIISSGVANFKMVRQFDLRRFKIGKTVSEDLVTVVTLRIQNLSPTNFTEFEVVETIPKSVVSTARQIQSANLYSVIQEDPTIQFTLYKIPSFGEKIVSYTLPLALTPEDVKLFINPLISNLQPISREELTRVGCHAPTECSSNTCFESRCIDQECYQLKQLPGTPCGPGNECNAQVQCVEKFFTPYTKPVSVLEFPSLVLIGVVLVLGLWIVKEYFVE